MAFFVNIIYTYILFDAYCLSLVNLTAKLNVSDSNPTGSKYLYNEYT